MQVLIEYSLKTTLSTVSGDGLPVSFDIRVSRGGSLRLQVAGKADGGDRLWLVEESYELISNIKGAYHRSGFLLSWKDPP